MQTNDFYEQRALKNALDHKRYCPEELIYELSRFIEGKVRDLEASSMLSLSDFSIRAGKEGGPSGWSPFVKVKFGSINLGSRAHAFSVSPRFVVMLNWGFLGMSRAAQALEFKKVGKHEFMERRWRSMAENLVRTDAALRAEHGAPMPAGLAAKLEQAELRDATPSAGVSARASRAL
jgi:hypothetical protein